MKSVGIWDCCVSEVLRILHVWLGAPQSMVEFAVLSAVGVITLCVAFRVLLNLLKVSGAVPLRVFLFAVLTTIVCVAGLVATNLFVCPHIGHAGLRLWLPYGVLLFLVLTVVVPLLHLLTHARYDTGLLIVFVSVVAAVIVVSLVRSGFVAAHGVERGANAVKERKAPPTR